MFEYCKHCGVKLNEMDDFFCSVCGEPIESIDDLDELDELDELDGEDW